MSEDVTYKWVLLSTDNLARHLSVPDTELDQDTRREYRTGTLQGPTAA